jgi:uncharacterized damage-inducible protein DinB
MAKLQTALGSCVVVFSVLVAPAEAQMTLLERQRLLAHMEMTSQWLEDEVSGLTEAQLTFRPSSKSWSILDTLDHLVVVGPIYWKDLQNARPAAAGRVGMMDDDDVLWYGIDRTNRETALAAEDASHKLRDVQAGLKAYRTQHAQLVQYLKTTKDDLRRRFVERQNSDAYQWALLISTHEQRHIMQIREIKTNPKYPKAP